jgi:hypothetical protein
MGMDMDMGTTALFTETNQPRFCHISLVTLHMKAKVEEAGFIRVISSLCSGEAHAPRPCG